MSLIWLFSAVAAPSPTLFAWVTESEGESQLALAMSLGRKQRFQPGTRYRFALERAGRPFGSISCTPIDKTTLRCRIEAPGAFCATCADVFDLPLGVESSAHGTRAFAGQFSTPKRSAGLVLQVPMAAFGPDDLLSVTGRVEQETSRVVGPHGLRCEGLTTVQVDPDPWATIEMVTVRSGKDVVSGPTSTPLELDRLPTRLELDLDGTTCAFPPASTGAETGVCGGVGVALHNTPACDLRETPALLAQTETLLLDSRRRCLPDSRAYQEIETAGGGHLTCGGRPPGDVLPQRISAVPHTSSFPWLK